MDGIFVGALPAQTTGRIGRIEVVLLSTRSVAVRNDACQSGEEQTKNPRQVRRSMSDICLQDVLERN